MINSEINKCLVKNASIKKMRKYEKTIKYDS